MTEIFSSKYENDKMIKKEVKSSKRFLSVIAFDSTASQWRF